MEKDVLHKGTVSGMKVAWYNMEYVGEHGQDCQENRMVYETSMKKSPSMIHISKYAFLL